MANALDGLTDAQREAVVHTHRPGAPLLILAGPGAGKTEVLCRRACRLASGGLGATGPLLIVRDDSAVRASTARIEALLGAAHEDPAVYSAGAFAATLLAQRAREAGVEELTPIASAAERLALLLEHAPDIELRHHDFRGRPLALFAGFVRRIDRLKAALIDVDRYAEWAAGRDARAREFGALFAAHERILAERGLLDAGGVLLAAVSLLERAPALAREIAARHPELLVDDWQLRGGAERELIARLAAGGGDLTIAGDDEEPRRGGGERPRALAERYPQASVIRLSHSFRCPQRLLDGARAVASEPSVLLEGRPGGEVRFWACASERARAQHVAGALAELIASGAASPERCAVLVGSLAHERRVLAAALSARAVPHRTIGADAFFERTEVRDVLAWLRLLVDPRDAAAVVRALSRPPIELHSADVARCVQIARRRKLDLVAGLPIALESPQLAPEARERIAAFLQIQRAAVGELDDERADAFVGRLIERLGLRRQQLFSTQPDVVQRLVNLGRLGELAARHQHTVPSATPREFAAYITAAAESGIGEAEVLLDCATQAVAILSVEDASGLEFDHVFALLRQGRRGPGPAGEPDGPAREGSLEPQGEGAPGARDLYVAITRAREQVVLARVAGAERADDAAPPPERGGEATGDGLLDRVRAALDGEWEWCDEELYGAGDALQALFRERRDELFESVPRVGARLGELRFDTDLDVAHGVVRLLELVKLAALIERREEQSIADALLDINARLAAAATPLQREILLSSPLDELLAGAEPRVGAVGLAQAPLSARNGGAAAHEEPSLAAFLPRRGGRLVLSATDIEAYRACPLRYKLARVLRVPREPTLNQRFGIVVHQALERFHGQGPPLGDGSQERRVELLGLLDVAWRRGGFGDSDEERQLREKARAALARYAERLGADAGTPRWFERSFSFPLAEHLVRGRVDRVDELPGGGYELIDYKTGLPRQAATLRSDVQLALYSLAAREAWQIEARERTYYYVLDDVRVSLGPDEAGAAWITDAVEQVGAGILAQRFEPTPSRSVCAMCDFRIACPAVER